MEQVYILTAPLIDHGVIGGYRVTSCTPHWKTVDMLKQTIAVQTSVNDARIISICKRFGLSEAYNWVVQNNRGSINGYHNTEHCMAMMRIAFDLSSVTHGVNRGELKAMLLACMFHDFDHTGANVPDSVNIELAIRGLHSFSNQCNYLDYYNASADFNNWIETAERLIRVTEFPFIHEPKTVCERLIRDADMLYISSSVDYIRLFEGLRDELAKKTGTKRTLRESVALQKEFINKAVWYTEAGAALIKEIKPVTFDLLDAYVAASENLGA